MTTTQQQTRQDAYLRGTRLSFAGDANNKRHVADRYEFGGRVLIEMTLQKRYGLKGVK